MRGKILLLAALAWAQNSTRVKFVFGLYEGTPSMGGALYVSEQWPNGNQSKLSAALFIPSSSRFLEPYGNDLAYDSSTKTLFIAGGGPSPGVNWGVIYGIRKPWRDLLIDSLTPQIGARRLAVKDTLLLATRNRPPFFTAYRIRLTVNGVVLDSLWSPPTHPNLRSAGEGLVVVGDSAFITQSYDPASFAPDSFIVLINLATRQVEAAYEVEKNPNDLLRIGGALYAACYGDFTGPLQIAQLDLSTGAVTSLSTGLGSFGGFTADTGGRDTIFFWSATGDLSAFALQTQSVVSPYRGITAPNGLSAYALLRVGEMLYMSLTNFMDTCVVIERDLQGGPSSFDSVGISIPSLRRFIYVEEPEDVVTGVRAQAFVSQVYPNPTVDAFYVAVPGLRFVRLYDMYGRLLRQWPASAFYEVGDLPTGLYLVLIENELGQRQTLRLQKL